MTPLIELTVPERPHVILEDTNRDRIHGMHIISLDSNEIVKLGRGQESDIRIPDVSVSRVHARLKMTSRGVLL